MSDHGTFRVGIVGGGFSGAAVAAHLAALAPRALPSLEITVFERRARLGGGLAYGDAHDGHLLNVPAGRLGLWPARPGHFHVWCASRGLGDDPHAFRPRVLFGEYAASELAETLRRSRSAVTLVHRRETAETVRDSGTRLEIESSRGRRSRFDHVVLALGHGPVRRPAGLDGIATDPRLLEGPWNAAGLDCLAAGRRILIVGTGLTMVDAALSLERRGFRGEIVAISRRGLLSRSHGPGRSAEHAAWAAALPDGSLTGLLRAVRARIADGDDWRGVIDALRPETVRLWKSLPVRDRRRFAARLAALWDVHRHRCPPASAATVDAMRRDGRLTVVAGRIVGANARPRGLELDLTFRGKSRRERFDGVILGTGGEPDPTRWGSPLVDGLLRDGLARADEAGLGLATDDLGFLDGRGDRRLSLIGPARRGESWESTAVPELSRQAASLAAAVTAFLRSSRGTVPRVPPFLLDQEIA